MSASELQPTLRVSRLLKLPFAPGAGLQLAARDKEKADRLTMINVILSAAGYSMLVWQSIRANPSNF